MLRVAEKVVGREAKRVLLSYIQHKMAECLEEIRMFMDIPVERWIKNSAILKDLMLQRRLEDF